MSLRFQIRQQLHIETHCKAPAEKHQVESLILFERLKKNQANQKMMKNNAAKDVPCFNTEEGSHNPNQLSQLFIVGAR